MDFDISQRLSQRKSIQRKKTLSKQIKRSITLLIGTLLFLIVILSIVYLLNTTQSNQKGFSLQQEQSYKDELLLQQRNLINNIIDARSINQIEDNPIIQGMIKPENPQYIKQDTN